MTWIAYALASAVVLSAVALCGIGGIRAVFLGGVLLGYLIEGVIVDELYLAFPFQLVWTPMAWHALITGVCVFGLGRAAPFWPLWRHLLALVLLGVFGATFASFWPSERGVMPPGDLVLFYLAGVAFVVPAAHLLLDRIGRVPRPPALVLLLAPMLALIVWLAKSAADPRLERLAFPLVILLTLWAMRRLGGPGPVAFGRPAPVWRHLLFPLAPAITALIAVPVWENMGALPGNIVVAVLTVSLSLGWWLFLLWRAARPGSDQSRKTASA